MARIAMLLSNPFRPDPRVHKEAVSLHRAGHEVTVIAWDRERQRPRQEVVDGVGIERVGIHGGYNDFLLMVAGLPRFHLRAFRRLLRLRPDVVHAHDLDTLSPALLAGHLLGVPVVYDAHESYPAMVKDAVPAFVHRALQAWERAMVRYTAAAICVTPQMQRVLKGYGAKRIAVVANCPDLTKPPKPEDVERIRHGWSPGGRTVVLYVGNLEPIRGLEGVIEGFKRHVGEDFLFVVGGMGPLETKIRGLASDGHPAVRWIGFVPPDNIPAHNAAADVLLLMGDPRNPNTHLSVANKVFEAMAAGRPIVVSRDTANAEVVESAASGLVVEYGNIDELFQAIRRLGNRDLYRKLAEGGRKAAQTVFNWGVMEQRLLALYADLIPRR